MSESVQNRFETRGRIQTDLIETFAKRRILLSVRSMIPWFALLLLDMLFLGWLGSETASFVGMLIVALAVACFFRYRKVLKNTVDRYLEQAPGGVVEYVVAFSDDSLHIHSLTTGGKSAIALEHMKYLMQINDVWMLVTKTSLFAPVFVGQLSETDRESVIALLKSNNPKIKIQLPKKK